jgi:hypothetical protein
MRKLPNGLLVMEVVIHPDEKTGVASMILASGKTESSFLREMIGLEPKKRGAPYGNKNRKGKKRGGGRQKSKPMFST